MTLRFNSDDWGTRGRFKIYANNGVRLVNGSTKYEGRVEVFYQGSWGTVCDDDWDLQDANVVCKMLGHSQATQALPFSAFGDGSGKIVLDNVNCLTEDSIFECGHNGYFQHNCEHIEDAGVVCAPGDHLVILGGWKKNRRMINDALSDVEVLDMQTERVRRRKRKGCDPTDLPSPVSSHASVYSSTLQSIITCGG